MRSIEIRRAVVADVLAHAHAEVPNECCGLLIGGAGRVERAWRARNLQASPTRYVVDPADHFGAIRMARAAGLAVVGAYHSHPTSAPVPSAADLAEAVYPDFIYLIASTAAGSRPEPEIRGYLLADGVFREVALVPIP